MLSGEYKFTTDAVEFMGITSGTLEVKLPNTNNMDICPRWRIF